MKKTDVVYLENIGRKEVHQQKSEGCDKTKILDTEKKNKITH